jgi:hypothetical protein
MWQLVPVATRSKAQVCGRSAGETVGSNPSGALDVYCCECCVLQAHVSETSRSLVQRNPTYCGGFCV